MTKLQVRAFLYQLGTFAILFIAGRFIIAQYTGLTGFWGNQAGLPIPLY